MTAVGALTTLVEWWGSRSEAGEHTGRWFEAGDRETALAHGLSLVDTAWTGRVRISQLVDGQPVAVANADRAALLAWDVAIDGVPAAVEGPPLPPRSTDDLRREIVCGCRDALALGLRAGLLDRKRVIELLHEIDRSFDPGMLEDVDE
ncbi:MAG: hypothetical protein EOP62_11705 [Sphingomonadales bacterium]|nr:MAG: hypothetical protein EOP62_11705 [Sphingomonadales bacterium]